MADSILTSFATPNYSGVLYDKGDKSTPIFSSIAGNRKVSNSVEFVVGQTYDSGSIDASQPAISEIASLTAPDSISYTRSQQSNVCQIFQESLYISDAKQSNMGTLSGVNLAGQVANPTNELDFQTSLVMNKIKQDIEYTFVNGVYSKATTDATVNKTRGLASAITTNVMTLTGTPSFTTAHIEAMLTKIYESNGNPDGVVMVMNAATKLQLNDDCKANGLTIVPADMNTNGIAVDRIVTAMGTVGMMIGKYIPAGTVLFINMPLVAPVEMNTPGKGNFYREELAKTGAGSKYQIFGQMGLDYGPEWFHGKITGLATTYTPGDGARKVEVVGTVTTAEQA